MEFGLFALMALGVFMAIRTGILFLSVYHSLKVILTTEELNKERIQIMQRKVIEGLVLLALLTSTILILSMFAYEGVM